MAQSAKSLIEVSGILQLKNKKSVKDWMSGSNWGELESGNYWKLEWRV